MYLNTYIMDLTEYESFSKQILVMGKNLYIRLKTVTLIEKQDSMMNKEIRWQQRFQNFEKAFLQLQSAIRRFDQLDDLAKDGLVQRYEYTFELAWKTIKDFLESKGEEEKYQRDVLKKAFQLEIIEDGERWLEMLDKRNLMSHTYNQQTFEVVIELIREKYYPEIEKLVSFFKSTA